MKTTNGLLLALLAGVAVPSQADAGDKIDQRGSRLSCQLPTDALAERTVTLSELFEKYEEVRELEDGYTFRFPGDEESAASLIEFVRFERKCCTFFVLELTFEPDQGPIWLGVRGSQGVKSFVESWLPAVEERRD